MNISRGVNPRDREYQEAYKAFRRRLRDAREQAGLTQGEVCRLMKKYRTFISKCESGERRVDHVELRRLARIYNKPVSFFDPPSELKNA